MTDAVETTEEVLDGPETDEQPAEDTTTPDEGEGAETEAETFPREYVEKLRKENGDYRARAKDRDDLAKRLHAAQVKALGRLADPTDLPYSDELLDPEKLNAAIDDLLARKPHLASRKPTGDVGQGQSGGSGTVNLADLLRSRA